MKEHVIRLRDLYLDTKELDPHRFLSFGILDDNNELVGRLHTDVMNNQEDEEYTAEVMNALAVRHNFVLSARGNLAQRYDKDVEDVKTHQYLTRVVEVDGQVYQFLLTSQTVHLADAKIKFTQSLLCITVGEDLKSWVKIESKDGTPKELPGGLPSIATELDLFVQTLISGWKPPSNMRSQHSEPEESSV